MGTHTAPTSSRWTRLLRGPVMDEETIDRRRWWTLAILNLSLFAIIMDNTILNVALPTLARDLQASGSDLQWIVDSYVLVFAGNQAYIVRVSHSATSAGFSSPSISTVKLRVTSTVLPFSSALVVTARARMRDPTFTGLTKRTLLKP